jgi:ketosteroid isomerase-like protein
VPEHPNAARYRSAFEQMWQTGDPSAMVGLIDPDVSWSNDIGAGPWREIEGRDQLLEQLGRWGELFEGTFTQELVDVCASDDNVVAILHEQGTARGQRFDNLALYRLELGPSGTYVRVRTYDRDRDAIEGFWSAVGPVDGATAGTD